MAEKIVCLNCKRESWTASPDVEMLCPYCGKRFVGQDRKEGENEPETAGS